MTILYRKYLKLGCPYQNGRQRSRRNYLITMDLKAIYAEKRGEHKEGFDGNIPAARGARGWLRHALMSRQRRLVIWRQQ
jgi:hypothetical protein